MLSTQNQTFQY